MSYATDPLDTPRAAELFRSASLDCEFWRENLWLRHDGVPHLIREAVLSHPRVRQKANAKMIDTVDHIEGLSTQHVITRSYALKGYLSSTQGYF